MTKGDWSRNGFFMQTKLTRILPWVFQHQNLRKRLSLFLVQEALPHRENIGDHVYCQISVRKDESKTGKKKKVLLTFLLLVSACIESQPSAFPITLHVVLLFCFFFMLFNPFLDFVIQSTLSFTQVNLILSLVSITFHQSNVIMLQGILSIFVLKFSYNIVYTGGIEKEIEFL